MGERTFYSIRTGKNPNSQGFEYKEIAELFNRLYDQLHRDGYFDESFGFHCEKDFIVGKVRDIEYEILVKLRKKNIWPVHHHYLEYQEDDLFDLIEFLYTYVSKPIDGTHHQFCGMHWETFNKVEGQREFREKTNELLNLYKHSFMLSEAGEILHKPEKGFERLFEADIPSKDQNVYSKIEAATIRFRRYGASLDDRRQAVRDLADVLEYLRPQLAPVLTNKDESDIFNIANNFGIRHHNDKQKTTYDATIWLSWMFYFYLSTIHAVLRKLEKVGLSQEKKTFPQSTPPPKKK